MTQKTVAANPALFSTTKEIAVSFWRGGSYEEARTVIREALESAKGFSLTETVSLNLILALVEQSDGNQDAAISILLSVAPLLEICEDFALRGKCHVALAYSYRRIGRLDDAIEALTAAAIYHEMAGEPELRAETENNLGNLLVDAGRFDDAQEHFDKALTSCTDLYNKAQSLESKAAAYLAQGQPLDALPFALQSVELLKGGEREPLLRESIHTLNKICDEIERYFKLKDERPKIEAALRAADGRITAAARLLGIKSGTLDWKLENQHRELLSLRAEKKKPRGVHVKRKDDS